jgi:flavin reductase (DIM6/NTAB) family NADH-FMN oxidoreductase RutF
MSIDPEEFKKTMRTWTSGVAIVTTVLGERRAGVTVNSFTSVSLEPPLVLICLQNYIDTYKLIEESRVFGVSLLCEEDVRLSPQFAGFLQLPEGEDRFYGVPLTTQVTGAPILANALAWMDCRVSAIYEGGISRIIVGEVQATGRQDNKLPVVYHKRGYYSIKDTKIEL